MLIKSVKSIAEAMAQHKVLTGEVTRVDGVKVMTVKMAGVEVLRMVDSD
jgi:hypothetical protein